MNKLIKSTLLCISLQAHAGLVGDFSQTHNLPGYIDFNQQSVAYRGAYTRTVDYNDGVITETPSEFLASYFIDGRINTAKIQKVINEITVLQNSARIAYCQVEQAEDTLTQVGCKDGFPNPKMAKKWEKKGVNVGYKYSKELFQEAIELAHTVTKENINTEEAQPFLETFFNAVEIYQGVVQESSQAARFGTIGKGLQIASNVVRPSIITKDRSEASNLLRKDSSEGSLFYSPEELKELKKNGTDISLLDPPDSGFWRKPKTAISKFDTSRYNGEELPYFQKELKPKQIDALLDPESVIDVEYEIAIPKDTGETPKIIVKYGKAEYKVKFSTDRQALRPGMSMPNEFAKVIRGGEVNTETAVNNIAAAMGFTVDGTYFKHTIRVFLTDSTYEKNEFDQEYQKMVKMLVDRFEKHNNTGSAFKVVKTDSKSGRKYIELRHVQLERKSDFKTDINIGSFIRKGLGKSLKREHRAFGLFLAWIWDIDSKDYNDALKLVPYDEEGKLKYKVVMSNSDMGSTLASSRPNIYNYRLVKQVDKDENGNPEFLSFNYLKMYDNDLMQAISFDDAKWIARLMAGLSEEQIYNAFFSAGYPDVIAKYYTGLMLKKRNELLDALNLFDGNITRSSEFNGTIKGYEEFFQNGILTDPENKLWDKQKEPFAQDWGAGLNYSKGEPQEYFIKLLKLRLLTLAGDVIFNSLLTKTGVSNEGLKFQELLMPSSDPVPGCAGACFFQGFNAGIEGFIPWRFIIENPNRESKSGYLIIDLFRIGFFAGTKVQTEFGLGIPNETPLGIGASHYQISEFIKITPVDDIGDLFDDKLSLVKMPKLNFRSARKTVIETLKEDQFLIQSHYIGLKAKARYRIFSGFTIPVGLPSITFRGDVFAANRVTFMAGEKSKILVGWDKIKSASASSRFNLLDFLILKVPVVEAEIKKLSNVQRTFEFDRSVDADRTVLFNNVNRILPTEIPEQYSLAKRTTRISERRFTMGFFNIFRKTSTRRSINVEYEDSVSDYIASNSNYVREITRKRITRKLGFQNSVYKIQASINGKNEIFARVKLDGLFESVDRYKFGVLLDKYTPMLPENFIQFDPETVSNNFGTLDMNIETIFPEKGLKQIFNKKTVKSGLCKIFARVHKYDWSDGDCSDLSGLSAGKRRFRKLWSRYENVRPVFWDLSVNRAKYSKSVLSGKLKKIVDLLTDNGDYDYQTMNLFIAVTDKANYYRRASMKSKFEAFPGQVGTIKQDVEAAGRYNPVRGMRTDNPEEEFTMFSDLIHNTIRKMFYNDHYANDFISG